MSAIYPLLLQNCKDREADCFPYLWLKFATNIVNLKTCKTKVVENLSIVLLSSKESTSYENMQLK